jgi:hypothetical protein
MTLVCELKSFRGVPLVSAVVKGLTGKLSCSDAIFRKRTGRSKHNVW